VNFFATRPDDCAASRDALGRDLPKL